MVDLHPPRLSGNDLSFGMSPLEGNDVRLTPLRSASRYSLRARDAATLSGAVGRALPTRIGEVADGIACLGPDEWYACLPEGETLPPGEGHSVSVVDISSRAVGIRVEGPGALSVVQSGCPLDLARFASNRATRTVFETVEIILWRQGETCFHLDVWRSFAPWLWTALSAAVSTAASTSSKKP